MEILCPKILGGKKQGPVGKIQSITGNSSDAVRLYSGMCKAHITAKSEYREIGVCIVDFSFLHVGHGDRNQVIRFARQCLYLLKHFMGPTFLADDKAGWV